MDADSLIMLQHLLIALLAGGLIGLERSYHGRPAGFRTHALVCIASSALMLLPMYHSHWVPGSIQAAPLDPTRMAQGIMTGIGFLGAGVIFKEGLTVRGLTTAASIWITAVIGILAGIGFYFPLAIATVLTLGTLSLFRWLEAKIPNQLYARLEVRFAPDASMREEELKRFVGNHGYSIVNMNYRYNAPLEYYEYGMVVLTRDAGSANRLSESLRRTAAVQSFQLSPMGD
ncbi:MAG TPA: MgtC/SapB family protein [Candidatus Binatia bacterium]|nr:MgtC/SapB family protein [Candidatus Binatia bacterium]